ncbi:MAG: hypothetical protein Q8P13_01690 [bacterium]|nr:hypothetical protein [bacterium]
MEDKSEFSGWVYTFRFTIPIQAGKGFREANKLVAEWVWDAEVVRFVHDHANHVMVITDQFDQKFCDQLVSRLEGGESVKLPDQVVQDKVRTFARDKAVTPHIRRRTRSLQNCAGFSFSRN